MLRLTCGLPRRVDAAAGDLACHEPRMGGRLRLKAFAVSIWRARAGASRRFVFLASMRRPVRWVLK